MLTPEQLALRKGRIGSSGISSLDGLNPHSSEFKLWLEVSERDPFEGNEQTEIGNALEPVIGRLGAERLGLPWWYPYDKTCQYESWGCATPDFGVSHDCKATDALLECKNVGSTVAHFWRGDDPPPYVQAQCQFQMHVTGFRTCYVAALVGGRELKTYTLPYDAEFAEGLANMGREFHARYIATDTPPPLDGSDACKSYLATKWLQPDGELIGASDDVNSDASCLRSMLASSRVYESDIDTMKNQLRSYIGSNAGVVTSEGTITWKPNKNGQRRLVVPREWGED